MYFGRKCLFYSKLNGLLLWLPKILLRLFGCMPQGRKNCTGLGSAVMHSWKISEGLLYLWSTLSWSSSHVYITPTHTDTLACIYTYIQYIHTQTDSLAQIDRYAKCTLYVIIRFDTNTQTRPQTWSQSQLYHACRDANTHTHILVSDIYKMETENVTPSQSWFV